VIWHHKTYNEWHNCLPNYQIPILNLVGTIVFWWLLRASYWSIICLNGWWFNHWLLRPKGSVQSCRSIYRSSISANLIQITFVYYFWHPYHMGLILLVCCKRREERSPESKERAQRTVQVWDTKGSESCCCYRAIFHTAKVSGPADSMLYCVNWIGYGYWCNASCLEKRIFGVMSVCIEFNHRVCPIKCMHAHILSKWIY
jgi:hypothetical protein